jgi:hypothetical protein
MSADNRICILRNEAGDWAVWHGSMSQAYHSPLSETPAFRDKESALAYAEEELANLTICEGGIQEITPDEQALALTVEIEDLSLRLHRLLETADQYQHSTN